MKKKILITGASGGFGKLTIETLLKNGYEVVGTVRTIQGKNKETSEKLVKAGAKLIAMDVTDDENVETGIKKAIELLGGLDVVINNAGVGVIGMQEHFTSEEFKYIFDVNVFGVQRVTRAVLPYLRRQKSGLLIFLTGLVGRIILPFHGPYNASKWALEALAESYKMELSQFGIECCIVEPGGFPTNFMKNQLKPKDSSRNVSYGKFMDAPEAMIKNYKKALEHNPNQNPQKIADAILNLLENPEEQRPFRLVIDHMGLGEPIKAYNDYYHELIQNIFKEHRF